MKPKYAIILPDGAADDPLPQLGGRTPLEAADIPNMDWIARHGRLGRSRTIPDGFLPGTDVGSLSLFGYAPQDSYPGRAPIEAAAKGLTAGPDEIIFRCNFVTILDGRMHDFAAGHIDQAEAEALIAELNRRAQARPRNVAARADPRSPGQGEGDADAVLHGCVFHAGVSYRNLMILSEARGPQLECTPPHDIPNRPVAEHLPRSHAEGGAARAAEQRLRAIMARAAEVLREHGVNQARRAAGRAPVSDIWLWGQGRPRQLEPLERRFGVRGAMIAAVDIMRGLARLMGMDLIEVPGATGYLDTDYAAKGRWAVAALEQYDLIAVHIEAPDEAAHQGRADAKIAALERIDAEIVGPLLEALRRGNEWRILIAPDHVTSTLSTAHGAAPPPFCFAGSGFSAGAWPGFSESAATGGPLLDPGTKLIEIFFSARG